MTDRSVNHATITVERTYDAAPGRVFAAWSDLEQVKRWAAPGTGWEVSYERFEFRPGGEDISRFGPVGGESYLTIGRYADIVPDARIVSAYAMSTGETRLFAGVLTVELVPEGQGTRVVLTEQGVFLDGHDKPENHEAGFTFMLEKIDGLLRQAAAA